MSSKSLALTLLPFIPMQFATSSVLLVSSSSIKRLSCGFNEYRLSNFSNIFLSGFFIPSFADITIHNTFSLHSSFYLL